FAEIVALFKAALVLGRRTCPSKDVLRLTEVGIGVRALPLRLSSSRVLSGSSRMDSDFFQNSQPALPRFIVGFLVGVNRISRILAGAHEAMPRPVVGYRIICLASLFHHIRRFWNRGSDARVIAGVETIDG